MFFDWATSKVIEDSFIRVPETLIWSIIKLLLYSVSFAASFAERIDMSRDSILSRLQLYYKRLQIFRDLDKKN